MLQKLNAAKIWESRIEWRGKAKICETPVLELSRGYVAYLLAGYGEPEVSAAIVNSSDADFRRVQEAANQGAVEGKEWLKVACRTAVEIVEGRSRELRRRKLVISEMPQELMAEDNRAYGKRAERFLGGAPVKKKEIFAAVSAAIAPELLGYKYFKSQAQFQKAFPGGTAYVSLHRGRRILYFGFGVTQETIEKTEELVFGPRSALPKPRPYSQTLVVISINLSPRSHNWPHAIEGSWLIHGEEGIPLASIAAASIVRDVIVSFIEGNQTPTRIRDTLLSTRGRIASMRPERTVFAIDHLEHRRDWLEADLAFFEERFQDYAEKNREELRSEYRKTVEGWEKRN